MSGSDVGMSGSEVEARPVVLEIDDPVLLSFAGEVGAEGLIAIRGGGTRWDVGGALKPEARIVEAPSGVVDYAPAEMTVKVRAGTTVEALEKTLAASGQRSALPVRGGTVGGAIAVGEDHAEALGRGLVRDSVLQVRYVSAEGRLVTGGGPVVKNVSGFNIPKLMTGSLGTLGLIVELVLRTNPIPAVSRWVASEDVDPFAVPDAVLRPSAVLHDGEATFVLLEGYEPDVERELARLAAIGSFRDVTGPPPLPEHRWSMAPGALRGLDRIATGPAVASIGIGRVWAEQPAPSVATDPVVDLISSRMKQNFDPTGRLNPGRTP